MPYSFDCKMIYDNIERKWKAWAESVGATKFVFGVSGGKDSTVIAYLTSKIFGNKNCYGVMMPNTFQADLDDSERVIELTGINGMKVDIGQAYNQLIYEVGRAVKSHKDFLSENTIINIPPRLRMTTLYAIAQTVGGFVLNTDNLSERVLGYFTIYGDGAGDFAPLRDLTATEVVKLGEWLGVPDDLIHKKPGDGLQGKTDEDRFGFTYEALDNLIRTGEGDDELKEKVLARYCKNRFKLRAVNLPGPPLDWLYNSIVDMQED